MKHDPTRLCSTGVLTMRSTVHNQSAVLVMEGTQRYLLKKRQPG
ncbi:hypothetical protein [Cupriavidus sp. YAF13]